MIMNIQDAMEEDALEVNKGCLSPKYYILLKHEK
jgi:hypothetical protein